MSSNSYQSVGIFRRISVPLMTKMTALVLAAFLPSVTGFSAAVPALRGLKATNSLVSPAPVANLADAAMPDVDHIFFMSQASYEAPDAMTAIQWLMAATVIATFLASSEIARTVKGESGILLHSDHSKEHVQYKSWMAGASLPAFEELAEGCYMIAHDAAETG